MESSGKVTARIVQVCAFYWLSKGYPSQEAVYFCGKRTAVMGSKKSEKKLPTQSR
jgi:hypothetical protein